MRALIYTHPAAKGIKDTSMCSTPVCILFLSPVAGPCVTHLEPILRYTTHAFPQSSRVGARAWHADTGEHNLLRSRHNLLRSRQHTLLRPTAWQRW